MSTSHPLPNTSTSRPSLVSLRVIRGLVAAVAQAGVPPAVLLRASKLDPEGLDALDSRVPREEFHALCARALELTRDPAFAIHSMERLTHDAINPLAALVTHSATLRQALDSIQEFRSTLGDEASFLVYEQGDQVIARCASLPETPSSLRRFLAELSLTGLYLTIRRFRGATQLDHVAFEHPAPDHHAEYARVFEGHARFNQPYSGLCFDKRLMEAPAPYPDPELHRALSAVARHRLARVNDPLSYAARVHQALVWQRPPRDLSMQAAARALGVSVRSLRRRLTAEGRSYASLVNDARAVIAKTCLRDEHRTISETAFELGFANTSGFHRAFKRWTGLTPAEYRLSRAAPTDDLTTVSP